MGRDSVENVGRRIILKWAIENLASKVETESSVAEYERINKRLEYFAVHHAGIVCVGTSDPFRLFNKRI